MTRRGAPQPPHEVPNVRARAVRAARSVLLACLLAGPARAGEVYEVRRGDTLAKIALLSTGDPLRYQELVAANRALLDGGAELTPGMRLRLPDGWVHPDDAERPSTTGARGTADTDGVSGDSVLTPREAPPPNLWDRLAFFPALRELDEDFEVLMLRAAYEADLAWAQARIETQRETTREFLEQQILQAEVARDEAKAKADECERAAYRAELLLQKYRALDDKQFETRKKEIFGKLSKSVWAEQQLWEGKLWPYLTEGGRNAWLDFTEALENSRWTDAQARHYELDAHRVGLDDIDITDEERDAFGGEQTDLALKELQDLRSDKAYVAEVMERARYRAAIEDLQNREACVREFYDAEDFLREKRRKLVSVQIGVGATGDALTVDAQRIADRYSGVLAEVQLVDAFMTNRIWTSLWWKAGVALRLAGHHERGAERLAQAAAVADDHRLPQEEVPRSIDTWLRSAENDVLRSRPGWVHVLVPPLSVLTVDGKEVRHTFGEADLQLAPGIHRFVFWVGQSEPIMRLVGVTEDGEHSFTWYEDTSLEGDEEDLIGARPVLPVLPVDPGPKRWHVGVAAQGGVALGRPVVGADLTVRYLPRWAGGELGFSLLVPTEAYWLRPGEELWMFGRVHGGVAFRAKPGRVGFVGRAGAYVDPLLGAGPHGRLELGYDLREDEKLRLSLDVNGGYDLTRHAEGIPRYVLGGGLGVWF